MSKNNLIRKKATTDSHLKDQVAAAPAKTIVEKESKGNKVSAEDSTVVRVSNQRKAELNAIVHLKNYSSVDALIDEMLTTFKADKLDDFERVFLERLSK